MGLLSSMVAHVDPADEGTAVRLLNSLSALASSSLDQLAATTQGPSRRVLLPAGRGLADATQARQLSEAAQGAVQHLAMALMAGTAPGDRPITLVVRVPHPALHSHHLASHAPVTLPHMHTPSHPCHPHHPGTRNPCMPPPSHTRR